MIQHINKKIIWIALFTLVAMSSCLKQGLPEYENWELNEINNVYVEHRFESGQTHHGEPIIAYQRLNVSQQIDKEANTVKLSITLPGANGAFTESVRQSVSQNRLWVYMDISTAAKIAPMGNTPKLGDPTDLTIPQSYRVTAANGDDRVWTIEVLSFD